MASNVTYADVKALQSRVVDALNSEAVKEEHIHTQGSSKATLMYLKRLTSMCLDEARSRDHMEVDDRDSMEDDQKAQDDYLTKELSGEERALFEKWAAKFDEVINGQSLHGGRQ